MTPSLRDALGTRGARFGRGRDDVPDDFGDPAAELDAVSDACAWTPERVGVVVGTGPDLPDLLNRLGTGRVHDLAPGEGRPTVLTSPKGRIVQRLWCQHLGDDGIALIDGGGRPDATMAHIGRFTFAERTALADASASWAWIAIRGPRTGEALAAAGLPEPDGSGNVAAELDGVPVRVIGHDLLAPEGRSLLFRRDDAGRVIPALDRAVREAGGRACGLIAREAWRVAAGHPADGRELGEDRNPLEAGLLYAVDFAKGCYVGQEVVARLRTYDKVSRLLRIVIPGDRSVPAPAAGVSLSVDGRDSGVVTSVAPVPGDRGWIGLAYVKRARADAGEDVEAGSIGPCRLEAPPVDPRTAGRASG